MPWRGLGLGFEARGAGGWNPLVDSVGEMDMNPRGSSWVSLVGGEGGTPVTPARGRRCEPLYAFFPSKPLWRLYSIGIYRLLCVNITCTLYVMDILSINVAPRCIFRIPQKKDVYSENPRILRLSEFQGKTKSNSELEFVMDGPQKQLTSLARASRAAGAVGLQEQRQALSLCGSPSRVEPLDRADGAANIPSTPPSVTLARWRNHVPVREAQVEPVSPPTPLQHSGGEAQDKQDVAKDVQE